MFTAEDYKTISDIVFQEDYPGYRPAVIESPNGDDNWDSEKRYAHIASKYLNKYHNTNPYHIITLRQYLQEATDEAINIAIELGVPKEFWPHYEYGALRILEYPPGSISNPHVDFDLFTLMCYRNIPKCFEYTNLWNRDGVGSHIIDLPLMNANELNKQIHFGEILELLLPTHKATEHQVVADEICTQYSIVYFSIPDHDAVLPNGTTIGTWIDERMGRSRKEAA
jgi:isopenicillin N synthase-like dioxygenase